MPEEIKLSSENLVPGTEIIRCIRFMQEQMTLSRGEHRSGFSSSLQTDKDRSQAQREALDKLVRRLSGVDAMVSSESLLDPARTHTQGYWLQMMEYCRDISGDPLFFFHYGAAHTPEHLQAFKAKWPTRPEHLFRRISKTFPERNEWDVESSWISDAISQSALVRWRSNIISAS